MAGTKLVCGVCGAEGAHFTSECPTVEKHPPLHGYGAEFSYAAVCSVCGRTGHSLSECPHYEHDDGLDEANNEILMEQAPDGSWRPVSKLHQVLYDGIGQAADAVRKRLHDEGIRITGMRITNVRSGHGSGTLGGEDVSKSDSILPTGPDGEDS